ncbi:MAG: hypothetical protein SFV54_09070 [Bryobacteraceae bacterium]|nr:hypothetical protein [Bryobacteraceae bacterium]
MDIDVLFFRRYPRDEALHQAVLHVLLEETDLLERFSGWRLSAGTVRAGQRPGFELRAGEKRLRIEMRAQERLRIDHAYQVFRDAAHGDAAIFILLGVTPYLSEPLSNTRMFQTRGGGRGGCRARLGEGWGDGQLEQLRQVAGSALAGDAVRLVRQEELLAAMREVAGAAGPMSPVAAGYAAALERTLRFHATEYELLAFDDWQVEHWWDFLRDLGARIGVARRFVALGGGRHGESIVMRLFDRTSTTAGKCELEIVGSGKRERLRFSVCHEDRLLRPDANLAWRLALGRSTRELGLPAETLASARGAAGPVLEWAGPFRAPEHRRYLDWGHCEQVVATCHGLIRRAEIR